MVVPTRAYLDEPKLVRGARNLAVDGRRQEEVGGGEGEGMV